ncbi:hypothetical protein N7504_006295 [Penicillium tannophilum]|nr:hypothetical protein N7504_006295 [Penicillium tannophilum]
MQGNDLPDTVPDTKEMETSPLSCVPCVTAPVPAPEQKNCISSNLPVVGDSQQGSAKRNEDTSATLCPSSPPTAHSTSKLSRVRTALGSNIPVRYPSIAVVVPSSSWKQGAARTSTRAAAARCKKRLCSGRGTGNDQDGNTTFYDTEQSCQKRKKLKPSIRPLSDHSDSSIPVSSHCSSAIQGVRGSVLLTIKSNSGLNPAYFFTFVPDPSPMLSRPHTAVISGKQSTYTPDENALLVRAEGKRGIVLV